MRFSFFGILLLLSCTNTGSQTGAPTLNTMADKTLQSQEKTGNGGNVVQCIGQEPVILDYYNASIPSLSGNIPKLSDISHLTMQETVNFIRSRFADFPAFLRQFDNAAAIIGPLDSWLSADLRNSRDANEVYNLPKNCTMLQAAVRQGTTMFGDPSVIGSLSQSQRGVLFVHEVLYYIADTSLGLKTSEKVRLIFREVLKEVYSKKVLEKTVYGVGGIVSRWQMIPEQGLDYLKIVGADEPEQTLEADRGTDHGGAQGSVSIYIHDGPNRNSYGTYLQIAIIDKEDPNICRINRPWLEKGLNSSIDDVFAVDEKGTTITRESIFNDCSTATCNSSKKIEKYQFVNKKP